MLKTELKDNTLCIKLGFDFSLARSCFCGQAFRWTCINDVYSCVIGDRLIDVSMNNGTLKITPCTAEQIDYFIRYFDLNRNYQELEQRMEKSSVLKACIPYASGIRVFEQEPFETLISFIISANNNIKRITTTIDRLCKACGTMYITNDGREYYSFPTPQQLATLSIPQLHEMGLGYRDRYIKNTSQAIVDGFSLEELRHLPYPEAKKKLCTLEGVGPKVADCILLFSLGHGKALPMDVWMKRAIAHMFFNDRTPTKKELENLIDSFGDDAGRIQQYIFHYARETELKI